MTNPSTDDVPPLRLGSAGDFERVESFLRDAQFDEQGVCRALKMAWIGEIGTALQDPERLAAVEPPLLALLIRLFLVLDPLPTVDVERLVDASALASFTALDLVRQRVPVDGTPVYDASVLLCPVAGLFVASDRGEGFEVTRVAPRADVVFPALYHGTLRFLSVLPRRRVEVALDLCAGSGIGALALSPHAGQVVSADLTSRATHFAEFNRHLNRRFNVDAVQGDLWEPVRGRTFDLIVAHPPYVPAESVSQIYRDAGLTGEVIVRRIIEELPRYLRPGGALYMVCAGWDTAQASYENRIRGWLGASANEFDIVFAIQRDTSPADVAEGLGRTANDETIDRLKKAFGDEGLERHVYGAVVLMRAPQASGTPPVTRRVRWGAHTDGGSFPWLVERVRWLEAERNAGSAAATLGAKRPRLTAQTRLRVIYAMQPTGLVRDLVVLETDRPFTNTTKVDPWMFDVVTKFDGSKTVEAIYRAGHDAGEMPTQVTRENLATLVAFGIERGFWEVEAGPAPRTPGTPAA